MNLTKQRRREAQDNQSYLHCPVCKVRRKHFRRISGGMEVWTCTKCKNVQSYVYEGCKDDDE